MWHYLRRTVQVTRVLLFTAGISAVMTSGVLAQTSIQPGDKLQLTVFNHPDLSSELTVTSSGDVRIPVAGEVTVMGLSQAMATERVRKALNQVLFHPSIDLRVLAQGQSIFFTGPLVGVTPYQPGETLGAAIAAFRAIAAPPQNSGNVSITRFNNIDLRSVRVKRNGKPSSAFDLEALERAGESGPRLEPGDVVLFKAKPVRVDIRGNLASPAIVYVYPGDTLAQAVAQTGPLAATTSLTSIMLHRNSTDTVVSLAGGEFTSPAHDGDIVTLQPAPRVSVLGMVEKAGDTMLQTNPTLLNALYEAGGPNRYADLANVQVSHGGVTHVYNVSKLAHGDMSQNAEIQDGDVVFVPEGHKIDFNSFANALGALSSMKYLGGI
jgi:polysaccharide export outer membrane protein